MWRVDQLLGNDRDISIYTTAATRQRPSNSNRGTAFSVRSVPICYKQDKLGLNGFICCELFCKKLVAEAGDNSGIQRKGNVRR
jgi:hypothetical protein